jgi:hypothetical protein
MRPPRRRVGSRPGLERRRFCSSSTNCSVGKALAPGTNQCEIGTGRIFDPKSRAVGVAEVELGQIPLQMGFADVEVAAKNAALQDGEVAFHGVGVDFAPDIFLGRMVHGLVAGEGSAVGVDVGLIGHEAAVWVNVPSNDRCEIGRGHAGDMKTADFAAAPNEGHNGAFGWNVAEGAVFSLAANVGLVGLDGLAFSTHRFGHETTQIAHAFADAMAQEPCGFHAAYQSPLDLSGGEAFFAAGHEVDDLQQTCSGTWLDSNTVPIPTVNGFRQA